MEGMRMCFERVDVRGEIVIGEGELDEAPMLYIGEKVGSGYGPLVDIAVDPIDGQHITKGLPTLRLKLSYERRRKDAQGAGYYLWIKLS